MKNIISKKVRLIVDVIMYSVILVIGYMFLAISDLNSYINSPVYVYSALYILAFLSLIAYFLVKKDTKLNYLLLSLISVIFATTTLINYDATKFNFYNTTFALIVIAYTIFFGIFDTIEIKKLNRNKLFVKVPIALLLLVIGSIIAISIYTRKYLSLYIMSYYFIALGLFKILETCMYILLEGPTFKQRFNKDSEENVKKKNPKKPKELKKRRPKLLKK